MPPTPRRAPRPFKPLSRQVLVVTGASTGIGRATAIEAGRRGASVVLAARSGDVLNGVARKVRAAGGDALVVVTDVAECDQVQKLADEAVRRYGRIDTWVNNAGIAEYATVEQMTAEEIDRIVRVDLLGPIWGCKAALPYMKQAGGGTIINVGSALSDRSVPLLSAYCAAKSGLKGFTESLRLEMLREDSGVHVTLILPSSTNTPLFDHARSKMGARPEPMGPVIEPEVVAEAILYAAEHPRRDVYAGGPAKLLSVLERISPALVDWYMVNHGGGLVPQPSGGSADDDDDDARDNLFEPLSPNGHGSRGRFGRRASSVSYYTRAVELHPAFKRVMMGAAVVGFVVGLLTIGAAAAGRGRRGQAAVEMKG